jgi:hypothetical protein
MRFPQRCSAPASIKHPRQFGVGTHHLSSSASAATQVTAKSLGSSDSAGGSPLVTRQTEGMTVPFSAVSSLNADVVVLACHAGYIRARRPPHRGGVRRSLALSRGQHGAQRLPAASLDRLRAQLREAASRRPAEGGTGDSG